MSKNETYSYDALTWEQVLAGYYNGIFPMGNDDGTISWFEADPRGILPIDSRDSIKISRSLKQVIVRNKFEIKHNASFEQVIRNCADRDHTWINEVIINAYLDLYNNGFGHSIEAWSEDVLVGGLYGIAYRGAFFGESMYYKESNASKVCVISLVETLQKNDYKLLDIQMMTPHFRSLGAKEIGRDDYLELLSSAMSVNRKFLF